MSLKTLVNDAFEDDPLQFLSWAYGRAAVFQYSENIRWDQRPGQAFMNVLRMHDPESYAKIAGSSADPFYVDSKIPAAIDKITSK